MKKCPYCAEEILDEAMKCKHCGEFLNATTPSAVSTSNQKLIRPLNDRKAYGVCSGLAKYTDTDPTLVRVAVVLLTLFTGIFPCVIAYIIMVFMVPEEGTIS